MIGPHTTRLADALLAELAEPLREMIRDELARLAPPAPEDSFEKLISVRRAAALVDVPEDTIRKWMQRGQVKRYKVRGCVRVRLSEIVKAEEGA